MYMCIYKGYPLYRSTISYNIHNYNHHSRQHHHHIYMNVYIIHLINIIIMNVNKNINYKIININSVMYNTTY